MATTRYRVHFVASFAITVDAPCGDSQVRAMAFEMEKLPWGSWAAAADAHQVSCAWNHIELVEEAGDDD